MQNIAWWPVFLILVIACSTDLWSRRIPNWLTVPAMVAGFAVHCVAPSAGGALYSFLGFLSAIGLFAAPVVLRGMGMGDLKLVAAIGLWIGPEQVLFAFVLTGMIGGLIALGWSLYHRTLGESLDRTADLLAAGSRLRRPAASLENQRDCRRSIPYAPAIALGTLISFFGQ